MFNFSVIETDINNLNGITYIKGLLGLSMIFIIFGQTFIVLLNSPSTEFGTYNFYRTLKSPIYALLFIGLRYSPRILFSCSGYTLVYKYLCFIENYSGVPFLKFLLIQGYKYILLIFVALFMRFSIYYIGIIFTGKRNPLLELFKNRLNQNNKKYILNLFTFLFYNLYNKEFQKEQSLIQYLYLPLNEVFLFLFGIIIISLGHKLKIRIDIIIIVLILLIYLLKILSFFIYLYDDYLYPTLYFNLSGYGSLMLNPIFNLPSFLIGMFFGLINYTIQRGINNSNIEDPYKNMELFESSQEQTKMNYNKENNRAKSSIALRMEGFNSINDYDSESELNMFRNVSYIERSKQLLGQKSENTTLIASEKRKTQVSVDFIKSVEFDIIGEMPFLKTPISFTNFHRKYQDSCFLIAIVIFSSILMCFFIYIKIVYLHLNNDVLAIDKIIPDYFFNIIYLVDIELVIFLVNWICFYFYFKGGQINDFLDNIYWAFFLKSYFSYILVLGPVILYIFYQSETVIKITIYNVILYSFINLILVLVSVIIIYSFFEYPLKKMFKKLKRKKSYINVEDDDYYDDQTNGRQ